ncbi:MAG: response regulator, partial [Anaerolineae bacterium]|nr:response regulator [Anaerolineae bacterium]
MKIIIVEDEFVQRRSLQVLLSKSGHEVVDAINGEEAWQCLQTDPIRLVITDWLMPVMNGLELIQRIRAANWSYYTYIIILTSKDAKSSIVTGLQSGADDYL